MSQSEEIPIQDLSSHHLTALDRLDLPKAEVILYPFKHVQGLTSITFGSWLKWSIISWRHETKG